MNPITSDQHVNTPLTQIAVQFKQDTSRFVADKVFPVVPVQKQSDLYYIWNRGDFNRLVMQKRAPSTESVGGAFRLSTTPYFVPVWALHKDIDDQTRANADNVFNQDRDATNYLMGQALLTKEVEFANNILKTGVWATDVTGVASAPSTNQTLIWTDPGSDPIGDIDIAMAKVLGTTGMEPNTFTVGYSVYQALRKHPDIIDRVKYTQNIGANETVRINESALAYLFGVERFLVIRAIQNTAAMSVDTPTAETNAFVSGNDALLSFSPGSPSTDMPSAGYTFSWTGYLGATQDGTRVKRFRMEEIASDRIEIEAAFAQKIIASDLGYFFNNIVP